MELTPEFLTRATELQAKQKAIKNSDNMLADFAGFRLVPYFSPDIPDGASRTEWPPQVLSVEVEAESPLFATVKKAYLKEIEREREIAKVEAKKIGV